MWEIFGDVTVEWPGEEQNCRNLVSEAEKNIPCGRNRVGKGGLRLNDFFGEGEKKQADFRWAKA